jgi:hypothetical protein
MPDAMDVVRLLIEELGDPSRRFPMCRWDNLAHEWVQDKGSHTVHLSLQLDRMARAVLAEAGERDA